MTVEDEIGYRVAGEVFVRGEGTVKGGGCKDGWEAVPGVVEDSIVEAEGNGVGGGAGGEEIRDGVEGRDVLGFLGSSHPGCGLGGDIYRVVC
jgi:hypothetical protein